MPKELLPFTKKVSKEVTTVMNAQDDKGLEKYNQALDPLDNKYDFLDMTIEEIADALKYLYSEKEKKAERDKMIETIIRTLSHTREEIKNRELGEVLYHSVDGAILLLEQIQEMK